MLKVAVKSLNVERKKVMLNYHTIYMWLITLGILTWKEIFGQKKKKKQEREFWKAWTNFRTQMY